MLATLYKEKFPGLVAYYNSLELMPTDSNAYFVFLIMMGSCGTMYAPGLLPNEACWKEEYGH